MHTLRDKSTITSEVQVPKTSARSTVKLLQSQMGLEMNQPDPTLTVSQLLIPQKVLNIGT